MKTLIFNWRDELIRLKPEDIVYFQADGNYSNMMLISKKQRMLTMNLSKVMSKLEEHLGLQSNVFERVGRDLIIRKACLFSIQTLKKQLILKVPNSDVFFELQVSKDALKKLKDNQTIDYNIRFNNLQLRDLQTRNIYPLKIGNNRFGRKSVHSECEQAIDNGDIQISRLHFNIIVYQQNPSGKSDIYILDLQSANGTYANNLRVSVESPIRIDVSALIKAGKTTFVLENADSDCTEIPH